MEWDSSIPNYLKAVKIIESCKTLGQLKQQKNMLCYSKNNMI